MEYITVSSDLIYMVGDISAAAFMIILVISVAIQSERRWEPGHLLAASIFVLQGILMRLLASAIENTSGGIERETVRQILPNVSASTVWMMAYVLIAIGISEAAAHTIYVNEENSRKDLLVRIAATAVIAQSAILIYIFIGDLRTFDAAFLLQFAYLALHFRVRRFTHAGRSLRTGAAAPILTCLIALFFPHVGLTGPGLFLMLLVLNERYHDYIERELEEGEEALAKAKVQLLSEQISPHYIYNSLQSIRDLCMTDPAKAREALDSFSEYLRGNLESLTSEVLIPFVREFDLTRAYLDLEKLTGRGRFDVEYRLETINFMLPPLVLQPVVENAVKHGTRLAEQGDANCETKIVIATEQDREDIRIEVTNLLVRQPDAQGEAQGINRRAAEGEAGKSAPENTLSRSPENAVIRQKNKSVGLDNVRTRLDIQCGGTLELELMPSGAKVTIRMPDVKPPEGIEKRKKR